MCATTDSGEDFLAQLKKYNPEHGLSVELIYQEDDIKNFTRKVTAARGWTQENLMHGLERRLAKFMNNFEQYQKARRGDPVTEAADLTNQEITQEGR